MVYLQLPTALSEEELMLQEKYKKLRKKKKAYQDLNAPPPETAKSSLLASKRPSDAKNAMEVAKKLLKSGAITMDPKGARNSEFTGFKRPIGLERKLSVAERPVSGYCPFTATFPADKVHKDEPKRQTLYESFVLARDRKELSLTEKASLPDKPRQGNTIFVCGYNITKDYLIQVFQSYGTIVHINMEMEKNRGFVTFEQAESATRAINEMNGCMVSNIHLRVSLARRQPVVNPINEASSSSAWSSIAANRSQKGSHKDKRESVVYGDNCFEMNVDE